MYVRELERLYSVKGSDSVVPRQLPFLGGALSVCTFYATAKVGNWIEPHSWIFPHLSEIMQRIEKKNWDYFSKRVLSPSSLQKKNNGEAASPRPIL